MRFVVVTGMSGAGKSTALKFLEDIGFFCVDNLPPALIPKFADLCGEKANTIDKVALGADIRGGILFQDLFSGLEELKKMGLDCEILFLDSDPNTLVKRYKETRRSHPLSKEGSILAGVEEEISMLKEVKERSTYIIDTSNLLTRDLKAQINDIFVHNKKFESLMVTIISFGFKYGVPVESDLVFDVRFIPNPFYNQKMRSLTGNDQPVYDFVMNRDESRQFLYKLSDLLEFLIPYYITEGKSQLVISVGCTGGKHRSVAMSNALKETLQAKNHHVTILHKDIEKDALRGK